MIPVKPQPEPRPPGYDFDQDVRRRGQDAIRQLAGLAPRHKWPGPKIKKQVASESKVTHSHLRDYDYWTRAMPALHERYAGFCAYLARRIEHVDTPTTDHFVALRNATDPKLAYEWTNYRLASGLMNARKSDFPDVLDPFEIGAGWFALNLGTFETEIGPAAPREAHEAIERTIERLGLRTRPVVLTRRRAAEQYWSPPTGRPPLPLWSLEDREPFVALELRRQGRLNPVDEADTQ